MRTTRFLWLAAVVVFLALPIFPQAENQNYDTPLNNPNPNCVPPYGYTWSCGTECYTFDGRCDCLQSGNPRSICMTSHAGTGCGCFAHECDACCTAQSCF